MKPSSYICFYILISILVLGITRLGSRAVTVMAERNQASENYVIVIDAGHGGIDGGATSCTGILESSLNLSIAQRLNDLFHLMGYKTVMIRTTDTSIHTKGNTISEQKMSDLKERVRIVNETPHSVLVSIHQNTFSDSRYNGAQVFYNQNSMSRQLAEQLQQGFIETLNPTSHRRAKIADNVYLMEHCKTPAVLIECGFLSNPEEEAKLNQPDYQKKLCCVIVSALQKSLSQA